MSELCEPVILLGRGGSGTRILSQIGAANGLFLGNAVSVRGDSLEWVDSIYALAIECVTCGVTAGSARDRYWCDRLRKQASAVLEAAQRGPAGLWGWKLPETMLALPQVIRAFPRARIIHLVRHPVTSALRRTHLTSRIDNPIGRAVLAAAYRASGLDPDDIMRDPVYVHNAVTWNFQVRGVLDTCAEMLDEARVLQFRYEEVCADPVDAQNGVARFLGREPPGAASAPAIDSARMLEDVLADERAGHIWAICGATATLLGYELAAA